MGFISLLEQVLLANTYGGSRSSDHLLLKEKRGNEGGRTIHNKHLHLTH